jgi:hypothetical protein
VNASVLLWTNVGRRLSQIIHVLLCVAACRERETRVSIAAAPLEREIARDLTARLGIPATTRCLIVAGVAMCRASVDGVALPVVVENHHKEWVWWIEGGVVATAPIAARVRDELADLGVAQTVDCGKAVARGQRVTCALSGGGAAFAMIDAHGDVTLELALDPAAAGARKEEPHDLTRLSRALEHGSGDEDDEEAPSPPSDGSSGRVPP